VVSQHVTGDRLPDDGVEAAVLVIARHVPHRWVFGVHCGYCGWPYPCAPVRLANAVLVRLGVLDEPVRLPPVDAAGDASR
jgi:hypothetical protein